RRRQSPWFRRPRTGSFRIVPSLLLEGAACALILNGTWPLSIPPARRSLVHVVPQGLEKPLCHRVAGRKLERPLELRDRLRELAPRGPQAPQIQVGKVAGLVPRGLLGLLEP